jgi:4-carboxymuconolactone decarboxylase
MPEPLEEPVRLPPLEEHEWSPATRERLRGTWLAPEDALPTVSTVRATLARHEKLFEVWDPFGSALFNGELPARDREVLVLRVAWLTRCRPEWAYHAKPAGQAGITAADIEGIIAGPESAALRPSDRLLVGVVDELRETGTLSRTTWDALTARYTGNQLIEVPMVVGHYLMLAFAFNSFGTPAPDDLPSLPARTARSDTRPGP